MERSLAQYITLEDENVPLMYGKRGGGKRTKKHNMGRRKMNCMPENGAKKGEKKSFAKKSL